MAPLFCRLCVVTFLLFAVPSLVPAAEQKDGLRGVAVKPAGGDVTIQGDYWALIIGINHYQSAPKLKTAVSDATGIRDVLLNRYGFKADHVKVLLDADATRSHIEGAFVRMARQANAEDSVLIYYAGHGQYSDDNQLAWWMPVEGNVDEPGSWILDAAIRNYVAVMRARHVYLIVDSCFSGTLFASSRASLPTVTDKYYAKLYGKRSRWGLTSGSTEPVADQGTDGHSVFAYHLLKVLNENEDPYLIPSRIAEQVIPLVARNADQMPRSQPLQGASDEGGQFILQLASYGRGLQEQQQRTIDETMRQQRDKQEEEVKKEIERLAAERRRFESEAKERFEKEHARLLDLQRQLDDHRRDEEEMKRQLSEERRQRADAQRAAQDAIRRGEKTDKEEKQRIVELQREAEFQAKQKLDEERHLRENLERQLTEQRKLEAETRRALEEEQAKRQKAERLAKDQRLGDGRGDAEALSKKEKRAPPFVGGF